MKFKYFTYLWLFIFTTSNSCSNIKQKETIVCITTDLGIIKLKLYNETPLHRNNFINLIKKGYFTDKIFERVIKNFMIQGGSSPAQKPDIHPESEIKYTIPAEFNPNLFHKRGTLGAARKGDLENPNRESTATQFYIVQGEKYTRDQLNEIEDGINAQLIQSKARLYYQKELQHAQQEHQPYIDQTLVKSAIAKAQQENSENPFEFSKKQIKTYTTIGGAPHLDGTYTVFGEVTEGMDVVDKIANAKTSKTDSPEKEIHFSIKILQ
jgi:cyclophilin family peptidyl-prolyl cis-trans isomerase